MTTTYSGTPSDSPKDQIRFYLDDCNAVMLLLDGEITDTYATQASKMLPTLLALCDALIAKSAFMPATNGLNQKWEDTAKKYDRLKVSFLEASKAGRLPEFGETASSGSADYIGFGVIGTDAQEAYNAITDLTLTMNQPAWFRGA